MWYGYDVPYGVVRRREFPGYYEENEHIEGTIPPPIVKAVLLLILTVAAEQWIGEHLPEGFTFHIVLFELLVIISEIYALEELEEKAKVKEEHRIRFYPPERG